MESNPGEAVKNIALATKHLADLAEEFEVGTFVMISSDKAVNPTNVMGANKRIAELYVQSLAAHSKCHFVTVRFGNVLGSNGSVIPTFLKKINSNKNLKLTHKDITRYFMTIPEAAQLVLLSSFIGTNNEILLFDMGKPIKIYDLAKNMISQYGNNSIEIDITQLRPGEKLYEELLYKGENLTGTENKKIMKLKHSEKINYELFFDNYNKIINFEYKNNTELKELFNKIVPEYNY